MKQEYIVAAMGIVFGLLVTSYYAQAQSQNMTDALSRLASLENNTNQLKEKVTGLENRTNYLDDNGGSSCTDDCSVGGRVCSSSTAYRICGNFDSDSCLEYGLATACSSGQTCTSGLCSGSTCLSTGSSCTSGGQCCSQSCQTSQSCESKSCKGIASQTACISKSGCQWYSNFFLQECRGTYQVCTTSGPKCQ
ncbi:MAG: hypothetical protein HYX24_07510 [Candidatus Aenigmarchaeota archaeon]|nr:hypothetical protein [Candidatus Aenigmarchaeota archaeon]